MQINIVDGYAVYSIKDNSVKKETEANESENDPDATIPALVPNSIGGTTI